MKLKLLSVFNIICALMVISLTNQNYQVFAQTPTQKALSTKTTKVTPTPTETKITPTPQSNETIEKLKHIEEFKEKIATMVSQQREKAKTAVYGKIKSIDGNNIVISGINGDQQITLSDDTGYYSLKESSKTESTKQKLKTGEIISAFGTNIEDKKISIAYLFLEPETVHIIGKIIDIDKANYTITIKQKQGNITVDIEKSTSINQYKNDAKNIIKSGFSKINAGDFVQIIAKTNKDDPNRVSATKLLTLSLMPVAKTTPEATATASPKPTVAKKTQTPIPSSAL